MSANKYAVVGHPEFVSECIVCTDNNNTVCNHNSLQYGDTKLHSVLVYAAPLPDANEEIPLNEKEKIGATFPYSSLANKNVFSLKKDLESVQEKLRIATEVRDKIYNIYVKQQRHATESEVNQTFYEEMNNLYRQYDRTLGDDIVEDYVASILHEVSRKLKLQVRRRTADNRVSKK